MKNRITIFALLAIALLPYLMGAVSTSIGYTRGGTAVAVADGGTGSSTAAGARTNLGLVIGTDVQALDADLTALAALSGTNNIYYRSAANIWSSVTIGSGLDFTSGTLTASGGGGGAPSTAKYITQTPDGTLSAEQALSTLATGIVMNTTTTGVLSIATEGTDYWKPGGTDVALADGGTGSSTASGARTNLGLGTIATQDANNVSLTAGSVTGMTSLTASSGGSLGFASRTLFASPSDGVLTLSNNAASDFTRLQFGGTTSSFPSLKRNTTALHCRLADDSNYASFVANSITASAGFTQSASGSTVSIASATVLLSNMPTSDPAVDTQVWSNAKLLCLGNFDASAARTALGLAIGTNVQAYDGDLAAIAALSGTNNIYYRSAANTWTSVTIGSGLDFTSGTLSATGGGGGAPTSATYITQTHDSTLSAEQALGDLATGIVKNTTTTGVLSIATEGIDYWKPGGTDVAVADGGTGASTLTGIVKGNGTSAFTAATAGTDYYKSGSTTSAPEFISLSGTIQTPTDATNYYFGTPAPGVATGAVSMSTTSARRRFYFPSAGTITKAYVTVVNDGGTAGTTETSTLNFRLNDTTDTAVISNAIVTNATGAFNNTSLSISVSAGDYCEMKWVTPSWATNPSNIMIFVQLEFHP